VEETSTVKEATREKLKEHGWTANTRVAENTPR
jgi:hypothetical protein